MGACEWVGGRRGQKYGVKEDTWGGDFNCPQGLRAEPSHPCQVERKHTGWGIPDKSPVSMGTPRYQLVPTRSGVVVQLPQRSSLNQRAVRQRAWMGVKGPLVTT